MGENGSMIWPRLFIYGLFNGPVFVMVFGNGISNWKIISFRLQMIFTTVVCGRSVGWRVN